MKKVKMTQRKRNWRDMILDYSKIWMKGMEKNGNKLCTIFYLKSFKIARKVILTLIWEGS